MGKKEFPSGFNLKGAINKGDKILIADAVTGAPAITTLEELTKGKQDAVAGKNLVSDTEITKLAGLPDGFTLSTNLNNKQNKEAGKSLVLDTEITKLSALPTNAQLTTSLGNKVDKEAGKSLVADTAISKLNALPTNADLELNLGAKVDKISGKGLSTNDYNGVDKAKVDLIKTAGDDNKFLAETGQYKTVIAPIQTISVNGENVAPVDGNVAVVIPDAPVQGIEVNGTIATPDEDGIVSVIIPKAPVQSVSVNGENKAPDSAGNVDLYINTNVEQTVNPLSDDPISSSAVASEFAGLSAKYGASLSLSTIGEEDDKKYSISLLDENGNIISTTDEFSGGGSGAVTTTKIVLTKLTENSTIKKGDDVDISFFYDHIDTTTQSSTGNPAKVTVSIISGALNTTKELNINANTSTTIDVKDNLQLGNNTVRVKVEVDNGDSKQVSTISWSVQVVNLVLSSNYEFATAITKGSTIYVPFTLQGAGTKILSCYVNGVKIEDKTISTSSSTGSFTIPTGAYNHGNVSVQLVAELELLSGNIRSNSVYYDLIIVEENHTAPIIGAKYVYQDGTLIENGTRPYISARQFEDYTLNYAVYDPLKPFKVVTVTVDNVVISNTSISFIQQKLVNRSIKTGDLNATIKTGNVTYTLGVKVSTSSIGLVEPTDNLIFKFNSLGKTNNDLDKEIWESSNTAIKATLSGVKFGGDGWLENGLRLSDAGRAVINYQPLNAGNRLINNSFTFQIKFKNTEVTDDTIPVIKCVDSEGTGFVITPTEAKLTTKGKADVSMKLASGEVYNVAFVSYPTAQPDSGDHEKLNNNMVYLYINGIMSGAVQRSNSDVIYQNIPTNITLGANGATTDIYGIRHFNRYLNDSEALDMFLIDIDKVDDLISKYNFNAQIDGNGNVTVDNVPNDMRYMIITGEQANGQSTIQYAQVQNNKDTRYDVVEILHVKKSQPSLNFKLVGGCIRLQGTSSLAYPIKNFRFYFKNSAKVAGQLFTGVDAQGNGGVLQAKAKFSFKLPNAQGRLPAPVDVWCAKADYMDSSSANNTTLARITNDVLVLVGDVTPAQKHVANTYKYDVRTTVDGEPCYIFYRNTLESTPVFVGKYNLNNDKSTENVFGFLDIPGYHLTEDGTAPSAWITEKFNGENPTECWEFLNNDYPMGNFLDDDFDTKVDVDGVLIPNWTRVFEARYPDNQDDYMDGTKKPTYLERFVKWVKSTQNNPAKFKSELKDYMDINHLCDYYMFTDIYVAVDQRVKNCMLSFFYVAEVDKMLGYYIFYDNDSIISNRNNGDLSYHWDIDHNSIDEELSGSTGVTKYAFEGHDSILWKNLREQFAPELEASFKRLRAKMSNDDIFKEFHSNQTEKFAERIYNIDAQLKYVLPKTLGVETIVNGVPSTVTYSYLKQMQGNRNAHRKWWLTNRLNLFDGKYSAGDYANTSITWKGFSQAGAKIKATPSRDYYFQLRRESTVMTHSKVLKSVEWSYTYDQVANIGTIFTLLGGVFMSHLNLSEWGGFTDLNLPKLPLLETLILGGAVGKAYSLTELDLSDKLPMMRTLDVRNYTNIPSLDVTRCGRLEEINARGCSILTSIAFAEGSPVSKVTLPENLNTLKLSSFANLSNANIQFPDGNKVEILIVDNCPLVDWEALVTEFTLLTHIRITGINKTGDGTFFNKYKNFKGVDENGTKVNYPALAGTYTLTKFPDDYDELVAKFPLITFIEPEYSVVSYNFEVLDRLNVTNLENGSGYASGTKYRPNGHIKKVLDKRYRCLGKQDANGKMNIIKLNPNDSNFYNDSIKTPAILDSTEGDMFMYEPEFWYKSIADGDNTYLAISTNVEAPAIPDPSTYRIIDKLYNKGNATYTDNIAEGVAFVGGFNDSNITVAGSLVAGSGDVFSIKINVAGYKRALVPQAVHPVTGSYAKNILFADANYQVVGRVKYVGKVLRSVDKIVSIPPNAIYMYITNLYAYPTTFPISDRVVLTKLDGDNIWDLSTGAWQKHKEELIGTMSLANYNGKLGSFVSTGVPQKGISEKLLMDNYLTARGLNIISYFQHKTMVMMSILGTGTTKVSLVVGNGNNNAVLGATAPAGNNNTFIDPVDSLVYYTNSDGVKVRIGQANCMGYENIANRELLMAPINVTAFNPNNSVGYRNYPYDLTLSDGVTTKRLASGQRIGTQNAQRYIEAGTFEVMPLPDATKMGGSGCTVDPMVNLRNYMVKSYVAGEVDSFMVGSIQDNASEYSESNTTTRIAFPYADRIVKVESVTTFKNITNFK